MSKLVNQSRLQQFATGLWAKIKERYDDAFVGAEITASTDTEKKIKFTKAGGGEKVEVNLQDYARLQDRNAFKKDVSVDDAKVVSNANVGSINGTVPAGSRTTGYRGLTSKLFTDGYVKSLRIYLPTNASGTINAHVWMIKKGALRTEDKLLEPKIHQSLQVLSSGEKRYIDVEIGRKFTDETFFVLRTEGNQLIQGINNIKSGFTEDIINVNAQFNPTVVDTLTNWDNYNPNTDLVGHMELHGRTGIVDISKRLEEINLASGNYVLQSDTTNTGGETRYAGKVVKLDEQGKLNKDMLPSIAVNDYFSVTAFTDEKLGALTYENGDVVVVENGGVVSKRYLCIHKGATNSTTEFVELNSRDGVVQSVNGKVGAVELQLQATSDKVKLNITSAGSTATTEVDIISDTEITEILSRLN